MQTLSWQVMTDMKVKTMRHIDSGSMAKVEDNET